MRDFYPITIVRDPNAGEYSGGMFVAFNREAGNLPAEAFVNGDKGAAWWAQNTEPVGVADTPEAALADLEQKIFEELQTCPFCGKTARLTWALLNWNEEGAEVVCVNPDCGATIRGGTRAEAVRRWNTREAEDGVWEV